MRSHRLEHESVRSVDEQTRSQAKSSQASPRGLAVHLKNTGKRFGEREVLCKLSLDILPGEFVAIVGKSGCGKSTLLRLIAQLESPTSGEIQWSEQPQLAKQQTRLMFQDPRLLPWKSVSSNVALGLGKSDDPLVERRLAEVGLQDRADDWPVKLSGGQKQRVALARALAHSPKLLALDEPLGALDALTRLDMQLLIESIWLKEKFTALLVTHDVSEAIALADRVVLLDEGRVTANIPVTLKRPRSKGDPEFARLEKALLGRILGTDRPA